MSNSLFERTARTAAEPFVVPYTILVTLGLVTLVAWLSEWVFNLNGRGDIVTFVTIATDLFILMFGMKPLFVAYSGQIGFILSAVKQTDPRNAVPNAVLTHFKVVLWMVFANTLVGLMLGTIPFGEAFGSAAMAFPNLLLLVTAAIIFGYLFDIKGVDMKKKFIAGFLVIVLGVLIWNWIGPVNQEEISSKFSGGEEVTSSSTSSSLVAGTDCKLYGLTGLPEIIVPNKNDPVKLVEYSATMGRAFVLNLSRLSISSDATDLEYMFDINQTDPLALDASGKSRAAAEFFVTQVCLDNGVAKVKMTPKATVKMLAYDADIK